MLSMNERPIPDAAVRDPNSVEMLRVWIADHQLLCSMKIGMYKESFDVPETEAWGTILADVTRHIANALSERYSMDIHSVIAEIENKYFAELANPTSSAEGHFRS
jgi:hypothetical protein